MFQSILVPLDGSKLAERAIPHAEWFARVFHSRVVLLQVLDPTQYREITHSTEPLNWQIRKAEADLYLQGIAARLRDGGIDAGYELREGKTAENIVDFAHDEKMELLILTTHGASGMSRWNTSSVVTKVIEKIYLPVLVIRAFFEEGQEGSESPVAKSGYERILLPIDSSRRAECALPVAINLVQGAEQIKGSGKPTTLVMAAVIKQPELPVSSPYSESVQSAVEHLLQVSRDAAGKYLGELQSRVPVNCEVRVVENENIASALHELVRQETADLVVLCAHGQSGQTLWPYGSVARNYIEYGEKHVLVIQDIPLSQVRPTPVEIAAEKYGKR